MQRAEIESVDPARAAAEAVKAYIKLNRARLADDGELLAMLLPERFAEADVSDLQRHTIERLVAENAVLRTECEGLRGRRGLGEGVRRLTLDLLDARCFEEAIAVAVGSASVFGGDRAGICIEGDGNRAIAGGDDGVRLIATGLVSAILGREGSGVILSSGGEVLFGRGGGECKSLAVFRLRLGSETPAAVYVVGARAAGRFEGEEIATEIGFFARSLERAFAAWLDLPRS